MREAPVQQQTLGQLAVEAAARVEALGSEHCHALIACSKSKESYRDFARNMYISPLYRKSVRVAEAWGVPFSILSAKYGLLDPNEIIEPYDLTLKRMNKQLKAEWASRVHVQIRNSIPLNKRLLVLAGDDYYVPLLNANPDQAINFVAPMSGLSLGKRLAFLNQCIRIHQRKRAILRAYELLADISKHIGFRPLRDMLSTSLPKQGVYFFFDENEPTKFSRSLPRLVRIGTHGVSAGSKATLRNRLRTHLGTRSGFGNHRASVFRLHIGRAIIERDHLNGVYPDWGKGQSASKDITNREAPLELLVSDYIGKLRVLYVPVLDTAGAGSMRATIERQFIAMVTEDMSILEMGSSTWLGHFSDKASIRNSGLWNVRDVGGAYDLRFVPLLEGIFERITFAKSRLEK